ncbi:hypothetical protein A1O3_02241 [Capronia epimyces CBS 606.96]|uniref:Transcription factor domain-containing protein n=1 Tax=Capronia epimyces CBS 606.96 TaxID=1182542 RepID=W9Y8J3_9EURO|nr:uncharacterized protein A1O3_02241 [Capronia epimyces CBS 606.96]EXJ89177.1 hypothetical protein A1O3_02241 [Capronia epimyces CBS 606.96]
MGVVATNQIVLMWLLLVIESQIVSFQPTRKDRQLSILVRRSHTYNLMNRRLGNPETSCLDDFILAVAIAGSCERRMGNSRGADHHIAAVKKLLDLRGGHKAVREIAYPTGLMIVNILVENDIRCFFTCRAGLMLQLSDLVQKLLKIQTWNTDIRSRSNHTSLKELRHHDRSDIMAERDVLVTNYSSRRSRAFDKRSALFHYVAIPPEELEEDQCRFYLGILFAINTTLWAFRDSENTSIAYLQGLTNAVELSAPANFVLRAGGSKLPSLLMLLMIAHHAVAREERNSSTNTVFEVEKVFEFVNMIMMASSESRRSILTAMSSWLTAGISSLEDLCYLSPTRLHLLEEEVEDQWLSDHKVQLGARSDVWP